jgi:hypothetical protein
MISRTVVGRILRQLRLDELPQFINVIREHRGPAPLNSLPSSPSCGTRFGYHLRQRARPGITGHAQVNLEYDSWMMFDQAPVRPGVHPAPEHAHGSHDHARDHPGDPSAAEAGSSEWLPTQPASGSGRFWRPRLAATVVTGLVYLGLFAGPLRLLALDWWNDPEAGHGLLLAPLALWLA